ncbi:MAG: SPOR domain-containing protein [Sphingobacteriales bacterium]|jgi:cell division septation protein DedD|nr:SPOR domain-containing protein [Sphingobacteriales bacterium]MBP9140867.1 SPOR domain-containing protein [Chitinophagales bacterium]MDA0197599.1 SPOR domain-containing protein [Bacteroidota bacterium]MBK6889130.1 SPOR domain-containing protein [Sphingobacteriales bacterium]MBK7528366.1 SPOR domain-containing protein [Sphingobacteriales bacterium]
MIEVFKGLVATVVVGVIAFILVLLLNRNPDFLTGILKKQPKPPTETPANPPVEAPPATDPTTQTNTQPTQHLPTENTNPTDSHTPPPTTENTPSNTNTTDTQPYTPATDDTPPRKGDGDFLIQLSVLDGAVQGKANLQQKLAKFGELQEDFTDAGQRRLLIGDYQTKEEAEAAAKKIRKLGFPKAFAIEKSGLSPATMSQKNTVSRAGNYYIKLGSFTNPPLEKFTAFADIGKITTQKNTDGSTLVFLGKFTDRQKANEALYKVKKQGLKDAFIMPESEKQRAANWLVVKNDCAPVIAGLTYMVQVEAKKQLALNNYVGLKNIGSVYATWCENDQLNKILLGPFANKTEADKAAKQVKNKGFKQAFVRQISAGNGTKSLDACY